MGRLPARAHLKRLALSARNGLRLLCLGLLASSAHAACDGHDLLSSIKDRHPADYARFETAARTMPFNTGTLFRITHGGIAPSFLLGTLHVADPRLATLPTQVKESLQASNVAVLETLDLSGQSLVISGPGGTKLSPGLQAAPEERPDRLLEPAEFDRLTALTLRRGLSAQVAETVKPTALAIMLDLPKCAAGAPGEASFMDAKVLAEAKARHIKTIGLETALEQLTVANGLPPEIQAALLKAVLVQSEEAKNTIESSIGLFQEGQLGLLLAWTSAADPFPDNPGAAIPKAFLDRIISARNIRMRDRLLPILRQGGAFVALGGLHIPGEDGLGALLERQGYRLERLL